MIYLTKTNNPYISFVTESTIDYIPSTVYFYLDDVLVGNYMNTSSSINYIYLSIPSADITDFTAREYKLKLFSNYQTIKEELLSIKLIREGVVSYNKIKEIKSYE